MPVLEALGTAVPGEPVPQAAVKQRAEEALTALAPQLVDYLSVFDGTGVRSRYFVKPMDWYLETHGWRERSETYREAGLDLLETAARSALDEAGLPPASVDGIVLVSTTGISTPSLDARLANRMGLRSDVTRVPVWGLGCAGGVAGLNLASDLARAHPRKRFLLVALETCSLSFNPTDFSVRAFVATTLFGDGAAAAVVAGDEIAGVHTLGSLQRGRSHQWRDTEWVMGWDVLDEGLRVVFSRRIPTIVGNDLAPAVQEYLKEADVEPERFPFHPGGAKVLSAYEDALALPPDALGEARNVLRDFGNMSSPTVLFALKESLARPLAPGQTALMAALGPGFTAELGLLSG